jgi:NADPH:quinone reductase-like Zn-dependent oxidoreductase
LLTKTWTFLEISLRAIRIHEHGGADKLRYEDAPDPHLTSASDAIVKLAAASLNHIDIRTRRGLTANELSFPHILGGDGAGTIVEIGDQAKHVKPGDKVCLYPASGCGHCEFCASGRDYMCAGMAILGARENGTYAEYIKVPARNCFPVPGGLRFEEAAAFPLVYLTMWRMLVTHAGIKPGEYVLILGVGGIAAAALQLAVHIGARVLVSSSSDDKIARAKSWGAERGINYTHADFAREVRSLTGKRGVDVVVDCIGGETWIKSLAALAKGGRLVTCGAAAGAHSQTDVRRIFWNHLKIFGSTLGSREEFQQVLNFVEATQTKPIIDRVFPLNEAAIAHQYMEERMPFGKVVLRVDS